MSRLSDDRISNIAHIIMNRLLEKRSIDPTRRGDVLFVLKNGFTDFETYNDGIDKQVREKIASLSKKVPEGSEEWRILCSKYRTELSKRQKIRTTVK